ncbi:amidohydrolase family protein [Balneola vulgaris]|jgi:imidazolonepropionase-like amidohydrolase|uniref:amidohydrolase family protein n=1 Tax=Balneola vulgaris TaxID=287535 RepID=UPI000365FDAC|nr:amidohydrolase family protein [Balneola vulgaris]
MKKFLSIVFVLTFIPLLTFGQIGQDVVRKARGAKFALTNAKIYTVTNGVIENGTIVINNGIIEAVGANINIPSDAEVINYNGQEIYPGMIDSGTQLGLSEIGSIAEAKDFREFGNITPQMQALTAVNPNSVAIPVTRVSGVTTALTMPSGGLLPGTAATINLFGYTPDQMFAGSKGIVMNFPSSANRGWRRRSPEELKKAQEKALETLNDTWDKAELYAKIQNTPEARYYPEMEALAKVVNGELNLYIEVDAAKDILAAIDWVKDRGYEKVVFTGVSEGWRVADEIAKAGIPVITGPVQSIPTRQSDAYDSAYRNPGVMQKAGVKVAIRSNDTENSRNLPYHAGFAAAYGMGREEALKAITINAAEIMGVGDQIGSIEVGKKANLFIATGDPFETATQIVDVFIDGYQVPMTSRHIELYEEFLNRTPGLNKHKAITDGQ